MLSLLLRPGLLLCPGGRLLREPRAARGPGEVLPVHGPHGQAHSDRTKTGDKCAVRLVNINNFFFQVKSFNDALTKEVEHNLNTLYDGTFQTEIGQVKICGKNQ